jgi:hypothetical protein
MRVPFDVTAQPLREHLFAKFAGGECQHHRDANSVVGIQRPSIEIQKQFHLHEGRALVSIEKRMVARQRPNA